MLPNLDTVLTYQNAHVIARYKKDYPHNRLRAEEAFTEMLKYLWLAQKHAEDIKAHPDDPELDFAVAVHVEMKEIDDMWHTFLLYTQDYMNFCNHYFGRFLHHNPTEEEARWEAEKQEIELNRYLSYLYDHLGEETLVKWFGECLSDE